MSERHRLVPAIEPNAELACLLTPEEGRQRGADTKSLFAQLIEQRQTDAGNEFRFRGDGGALWEQVSLFVDEESRCCPFFEFEQLGQPDGVVLIVRRASDGY